LVSPVSPNPLSLPSAPLPGKRELRCDLTRTELAWLVAVTRCDVTEPSRCSGCRSRPQPPGRLRKKTDHQLSPVIPSYPGAVIGPRCNRSILYCCVADSPCLLSHVAPPVITACSSLRSAYLLALRCDCNCRRCHRCCCCCLLLLLLPPLLLLLLLLLTYWRPPRYSRTSRKENDDGNSESESPVPPRPNPARSPSRLTPPSPRPPPPPPTPPPPTPESVEGAAAPHVPPPRCSGAR